MNGWTITLIVVVAIIVLILLYVMGVYNKLVKLKNRVKNQWSQIEVLLKRRADLIPNLVETVKGYAKHEKDTLQEVISLRNTPYESMSDDEKVKTNQKLSQSVTKIMALAEAYPELKANENFKELSKDLSKIEEDIANSRKYYNGTVRTYNDKIEMVPSNIVAGIFGFKTRTMFEVDAAERENVKVKF